MGPVFGLRIYLGFCDTIVFGLVGCIQVAGGFKFLFISNHDFVYLVYLFCLFLLVVLFACSCSLNCLLIVALLLLLLSC